MLTEIKGNEDMSYRPWNRESVGFRGVNTNRYPEGCGIQSGKLKNRRIFGGMEKLGRTKKIRVKKIFICGIIFFFFIWV